MYKNVAGDSMNNKFIYNEIAINDLKNCINNAISYANEIKENISSINNLLSYININNNISSYLNNLNNELDRIYNIPKVINEWEFIILISNGDFKSKLKSWILNGEVTCEDLVNMSDSYMKALVAINGNDYYTQLKEIQNPYEALKEAGMNEEYLNKLNEAFIEKLVDEDLMYTGKGVAYMAYSFTGLLAMFGLALDYNLGGNYDSKENHGFYLGNSNNMLGTLDCNNYYDWLCRCVGITGDNSRYRAVEKYKRGVDGITQEDRIQVNSSSPNYKTGNSGDIMNNERHMIVILENTGKGYWISEESACARIQYLTYEECAKKGYLLNDMSALYRNTSKSQSGAQYQDNNYIPPEVYKNYFENLKEETMTKLIAQYNKRNLANFDKQTIINILNNGYDDGSNRVTNISTLPNTNYNYDLRYALDNIDNIDFDSAWDNSIMINVIDEKTKNAIGSYPIDEYVAGVILGESVARMYYEGYYEGKNNNGQVATDEEMLASMMAFAVLARSYGIAQTVESPRHAQDHKIEAGSSKQWFSASRLKGNGERTADAETVQKWAKLAKLAAYLTSGKVLSLDGDKVTNAGYGSRKQHELIQYAINNHETDYTKILENCYSNEDYKLVKAGTEVYNYNYSTESINNKYNSVERIDVKEPQNNNNNETIKTGTEAYNYNYSTESINNKYNNIERIDVKESQNNNNNETIKTGNTNKNTETTKEIPKKEDIIIEVPKPNPINVLPENLFSDIVPPLKEGKLGYMEISNKHVMYELTNIKETAYNSYISLLEQNGFTFNGEAFVKENYIVNLKYDNNTLSLTINIV